MGRKRYHAGRPPNARGSESPLRNVTKTATYTILPQDRGTRFSNEGAVGAATARPLNTPTLADVDTGFRFSIYVADAVGIRLVATDGTIDVGTVPNLGAVTFEVAGNIVSVMKYDASTWLASSSLGDETRHGVLDTLLHNIAEDCYVEPTTSGALITVLTAWTDSGKTTKIREITISYSGAIATQFVIVQYDDDGVAVSGQTMTGTVAGSDPIPTSITWVMS